MIDANEFRKKLDAQSDNLEAVMSQAFEKWKADPLVRLTISTMPPMEPPESLETLLQHAFKAGFGSGGIHMVMDFLKTMRAP